MPSSLKHFYHGLLPVAMLPAVKWIILCFIFLPATSYSQENVLAIMSNQGKIYQDFYFALRSKLAGNATVEYILADDVTDEILNKYKIVIPAGSNAAVTVSKHKSSSTIIYSFIPDEPHLLSNISCTKKCYIVYINQPVTRYLKLFKVLFNKNYNLVSVISDKENDTSKKIRAITKETGITYSEIFIKKDGNIARTLINQLKKNDVLLALPNPDIYNKYNAKSIILSAYHKNVPIIAYSKAFAKAGALISLYSSIENVAEEAANVVNKIISDGQPKQQEFYPEKFSININPAVSSSLNINTPSENEIKRKIK